MERRGATFGWCVYTARASALDRAAIMHPQRLTQMTHGDQNHYETRDTHRAIHMKVKKSEGAPLFIKTDKYPQQSRRNFSGGIAADASKPSGIAGLLFGRFGYSLKKLVSASNYEKLCERIHAHVASCKPKHRRTRYPYFDSVSQCCGNGSKAMAICSRCDPGALLCQRRMALEAVVKKGWLQQV